jgi:hypothetical protein
MMGDDHPDGEQARLTGIRSWAVRQVGSNPAEAADELIEAIAAATLCPLCWLPRHDGSEGEPQGG